MGRHIVFGCMDHTIFSTGHLDLHVQTENWWLKSWSLVHITMNGGPRFDSRRGQFSLLFFFHFDHMSASKVKQYPPSTSTVLRTTRVSPLWAWMYQKAEIT